MNRKLTAIILAAAALIALAGCGGAKNVTPAAPAAPATAPATETKAPAPAPAAVPANAIKVGATGGTNVKLTVNSVRFTTENGDKKAKEGYTYAIVEATVENAGKAAYHSSALVNFAAKTADGVSYDRASYTGLKSLDGDVAPGAKLTGEVAFLVPLNAKSLLVEFAPDLLDSKSYVVVNLGDVK